MLHSPLIEWCVSPISRNHTTLVWVLILPILPTNAYLRKSECLYNLTGKRGQVFPAWPSDHLLTAVLLPHLSLFLLILALQQFWTAATEGSRQISSAKYLLWGRKPGNEAAANGAAWSRSSPPPSPAHKPVTLATTKAHQLWMQKSKHWDSSTDLPYKIPLPSCWASFRNVVLTFIVHSVCYRCAQCNYYNALHMWCYEMCSFKVMPVFFFL